MAQVQFQPAAPVRETANDTPPAGPVVSHRPVHDSVDTSLDLSASTSCGAAPERFDARFAHATNGMAEWGRLVPGPQGRDETVVLERFKGDSGRAVATRSSGQTLVVRRTPSTSGYVWMPAEAAGLGGGTSHAKADIDRLVNNAAGSAPLDAAVAIRVLVGTDRTVSFPLDPLRSALRNSNHPVAPAAVAEALKHLRNIPSTQLFPTVDHTQARTWTDIEVDGAPYLVQLGYENANRVANYLYIRARRHEEETDPIFALDIESSAAANVALEIDSEFVSRGANDLSSGRLGQSGGSISRSEPAPRSAAAANNDMIGDLMVAQCRFTSTTERFERSERKYFNQTRDALIQSMGGKTKVRWTEFATAAGAMLNNEPTPRAKAAITEIASTSFANVLALKDLQKVERVNYRPDIIRFEVALLSYGTSFAQIAESGHGEDKFRALSLGIAKGSAKLAAWRHMRKVIGAGAESKGALDDARARAAPASTDPAGAALLHAEEAIYRAGMGLHDPCLRTSPATSQALAIQSRFDEELSAHVSTWQPDSTVLNQSVRHIREVRRLLFPFAEAADFLVES